MEAFIKNAESKISKAIDSLKIKYSAIRTGRASSSLVDNIMVEYYGANCPLKQLASIAVPESRTITIQPFDKSALLDIEKAIQKSNLGINPKNEGGRIILSIPQLTEERRKELTKIVKSEAEGAKVSIRNIRREILDDIKKKKTSKELSEDLAKNQEEAVQKVIDRFSKQIEVTMALKEKEILEV